MPTLPPWTKDAMGRRLESDRASVEYWLESTSTRTQSVYMRLRTPTVFPLQRYGGGRVWTAFGRQPRLRSLALLIRLFNGLPSRSTSRHAGSPLSGPELKRTLGPVFAGLPSPYRHRTGPRESSAPFSPFRGGADDTKSLANEKTRLWSLPQLVPQLHPVRYLRRVGIRKALPRRVAPTLQVERGERERNSGSAPPSIAHPLPLIPPSQYSTLATAQSKLTTTRVKKYRWSMTSLSLILCTRTYLSLPTVCLIRFPQRRLSRLT